jgi:hypothetical protein
MEAVEAVTKGWQIIVGIVTVVVIAAQAHLRIAVLEEKVRTLFDLVNKHSAK